MWKDGAIVEPTIVPIATLTPSATDVIVTINDMELGWRCDTFEQSDYHVKAIYDKPDSGILRVEVFVFPNNAHAHDAFVGALSVEENVFANDSMNIGNESYIIEYDDDTLGLFRYKNVLCLTQYQTKLKFSEIDTVKKYSKLMYDKIDNQSQKGILIPTSATTPTPVTPTAEPTQDTKLITKSPDSMLLTIDDMPLGWTGSKGEFRYIQSGDYRSVKSEITKYSSVDEAKAAYQDLVPENTATTKVNFGDEGVGYTTAAGTQTRIVFRKTNVVVKIIGFSEYHTIDMTDIKMLAMAVEKKM